MRKEIKENNPLADIEVNKLLQSLKENINKINKTEALKIYNYLIENHKSLELEEEHKQDIYKAYIKLNILKTINDTHKEVDNSNRESLSHNLIEIKKMYANIGINPIKDKDNYAVHIKNNLNYFHSCLDIM